MEPSTCYRITEIDRSVAFYEALGFEERGRFPIRDEAINVFMGLPGDGDRLWADLQLASTRTRSAPATATSRSRSTTSTQRLPSSPSRASSRASAVPSARADALVLCSRPDEYRIELIERATG
jgi:lactoylglutathione lyase